MQPVAWAVICPGGQVSLHLDHARALQYAAEHAGRVEPLVMLREVSALLAGALSTPDSRHPGPATL